MTTKYKAVNSCRGCNSSQLEPLFSLGHQYVIDFPPPGCEKNGIVAPLDVIKCNDCNLVQLRHTANQDSIYAQYWYKSGINETMKDHLRDVVNNAMKHINLDKGQIVVDIGANDGTLASFYPDYVHRVGFEPSYNVWQESAKIDWYKSYNEYFSHKVSDAKVITSCAMFYDLENPHQFLEDIRCTLADDGIWIDQQNYLVSMLRNYAYDNISHEHLEYYSLTTFKNLVDQHDLEIRDVSTNSVNGGSFRTSITRKNSKLAIKGGPERVQDMLDQEAKLKLDTRETYEKFFSHIQLVSHKLFDFVMREKTENNASFYLYGASTRGQTIVQFCGLDNTLISAASERNTEKFMKVTMGSNIPIVSEEVARVANPDYMIVLPYSFRKQFLEREAKYLDAGGSFIFPLPEVEIISKNRVRTL